MKSGFFIFFAMLVSSASFASPTFTLVDDRSGARYQCDQNGGGGGGGTPIDQRCVENVASYCYNNTSYGRDTCFNRASQACSGAAAGFSNCVSSSAAYCYNNTSYGRDTCFNRAIESCGGNFDAIREIIEGVKEKALFDAKIKL